MKRGLLLIIVFIILFTINTSTFAAEHEQQIKILLICSYNAEFMTYSDQIDGIRSVLPEDQYVIDVEFMDAKNYNEEEDIQIFLKR